MAIHTAHDRLFHATFRHPRLTAAWLRAVLPARVVTALDLGTLTPATDGAVGLRLHSHRADLVFTVRLAGSDEWVLLVLEHKAAADPRLASQVLRYVVHLRRLSTRAGVDEPWSLVVVLHHAAQPFMPRERVPPPALAALQPTLAFVVHDLAGRSEQELRNPELPAQVQLTLLALARLRGFVADEVPDAIDRWGDLLRAVAAEGAPTPDDALDAFAEYALRTTDVAIETLQQAFARNLDPMDSTIMTTAERLLREGHARGLTQGLSQGLSQGLTQGLCQGRAQALIRLLTRRFGPLPEAIQTRLAAATPDDLDRWTDRVLDAPSLAAVFAPLPGQPS